MTAPPPTFYLYGEPHRASEDGFVHVESLDDRSRPNEWTIRPHSHTDLAHIFYLASGGGNMIVDGRRLPCPAPCLVLMPAGAVHGFDWEEETSGSVVTIATRRLLGLSWLAPETADLLTRADIIALPAAAAAQIEPHITDLLRELGWARIGHDTAVQSALLAILVGALRQRATPADPSAQAGRQRALVARMRSRVEDRFRLREPVSAYARALGTSETALRLACANVGSSSPAAMIDQRALLEARRALVFSAMTVSEIAYSLGFEDPSYFSRFFTRHAGQSPRHYRAERRQ